MLINLEGRTTSLAGTGTAAANKWTGGKGDPAAAIKNGIAQCFFRPNTMVFNEAVYDALEYYPVLLQYLGEANLIKKVDEANLAKLFRIDKAIIARGKADFEKRNKNGSVNPQSVWSGSVVLCCADGKRDQPCADKTLASTPRPTVRAMWCGRGTKRTAEYSAYVQVAHDAAEIIVCKELVYTIKSVL